MWINFQKLWTFLDGTKHLHYTGINIVDYYEKVLDCGFQELIVKITSTEHDMQEEEKNIYRMKYSLPSCLYLCKNPG